jgi:hypothetical protein
MKHPGTLGISVTAWQGLSPRDKQIFKFCFDVLVLGISAIYIDPTTKRWATFTHWDWVPQHIAILGVLAGNADDIPPGYEIPMDGDEIDRAALKDDILAFCESHGYVEPTAEMETWQDVLDAQGAPSAVIRMADAVPPTWTPEEVEEP